MRKLCVFVFLVVALQYCISCQKQLLFEDPASAGVDSVTLVKTIHDLEYDSSDAFLSQEWQTFTYDSILNRTVVDIADSDRYDPGNVTKYTAIFQYDASNRLSKFSTTGGYEPVAQMDLTYGNNGDLIKLTMNNNWMGKTFDIQFTTTTQNGQKIITAYDTSGIYAANAGDSRPEISKYVFDSNNRLVAEDIYYTYFKDRKNWFEDTNQTKFSYGNNDFITKQLYSYAYHFSPNDPTTVVNTDSLLYTGEGNNKALLNSFLYVYKNMFWLNISEYSTGFTNAINKGELVTHCGAAIKTIESWAFSPPDPALKYHRSGIVDNIFDSAGLLTKCTYPKKFGNKYGGKTEFSYTYTKIKK